MPLTNALTIMAIFANPLSIISATSPHIQTQNRPEFVAKLYMTAFLNGDYKKALDTYDELIKRHDYDRNVHLFKACCYYALNQYKDAKKECKKAEDEGEVDEALLNRLQLHLAHKMMDEENIMHYHSKLTNTVED